MPLPLLSPDSDVAASVTLLPDTTGGTKNAPGALADRFTECRTLYGNEIAEVSTTPSVAMITSAGVSPVSPVTPQPQRQVSANIYLTDRQVMTSASEAKHWFVVQVCGSGGRRRDSHSITVPPQLTLASVRTIGTERNTRDITLRMPGEVCDFRFRAWHSHPTDEPYSVITRHYRQVFAPSGLNDTL